MAAAALVLSGIGILISIAVAVYARQASDEQQRRSDAIQERLAVIEEARRHDERTPDIEGTWVSRAMSIVGVRLTNLGPVDIDKVAWSFQRDDSRHRISKLGDPPSTEGTFGPLVLGHDHILPARTHGLGPMGPTELVLICRCSIAGEPDRIVPVKVRTDPATPRGRGRAHGF